MRPQPRVTLLIAAPALLMLLVLAPLGPIAQPLAYHAFADSRPLGPLPNAADLLSNIAFLLAGCWGLWRLRNHSDWLDARLFALAVALIGLGSGWYHLAPDNASLSWDRLPMAFAFASLITLLLRLRFDTRLAARLRLPLLLFSAGSVLWWHWSEQWGTGDLRLYLLVQAYPLLALPLWLLSDREKRLGRGWWWVVVGYALAKLAELGDGLIFGLGGFVSGHTLKHVVAAVTTAWVVHLALLNAGSGGKKSSNADPE